VGAGLASSAALTVAAAKALGALGGARLTGRQLAGVAYRAEHDRVGVRCGVMDQMIAALAKPGYALLVECASAAMRYIPFRGLLYEAHESCRRLYQCSAPELDLVVAAARRAGAHGARLTGAGWGGAVIVLLGKGEGGRGKGERQIAEAITRAFLRAYGREPVITPVRPSGGVRREAV